MLGGWHLANNALYMYPYIDVDTTELPKETASLNRMVKAYFDTIPREMVATPLKKVGGYFIISINSPLSRYSNLIEWNPRKEPQIMASVAPLYYTYGTHLIKKHPLAYIRYYVLPNTLIYLVPPAEKLGGYDGSYDRIDTLGFQWFDYEARKKSMASAELQKAVLVPLPFIFLLINLTFVGGFIAFALRRNKKKYPILWNALLISGCLYLTNMGFSIFAAPMLMRYQIFFFIIFSGFSAVLIDTRIRLDEKSRSLKLNRGK